MKVIITILLGSVGLLIACSRSESSNIAKLEADSAARTQPSPLPSPDLLTSEQVMTALKNADLPIINEIMYTEQSDPNNLLGRPGQYVGKVNFSDKRIEKTSRDKQGCTVEVFASLTDMENRKSYLNAVTGPTSVGPGKQYIYAHKNALLRLEFAMLPKDAAVYEQVLKSL